LNARIFLLVAIVVLTIVGALAFELPGSGHFGRLWVPSEVELESLGLRLEPAVHGDLVP